MAAAAAAKIAKLVADTKHHLGPEGKEAIPALESFVQTQGFQAF
jgi:hypothetical protein